MFRGEGMGAEGKQSTAMLQIITGIQNGGELNIVDAIVILDYMIIFEADSSLAGVEEFLTAR
jgi:hypothetical protein